ncbi:hypothetical protein ESZ36_12600 [Colwellia demingiae]|uniref:Uncharacterized protein n=1 Tax=Colwellia demingiae TaxID=89401 RepID=A0A5C6QEH4_9GAMM|nr:VPA1267 family protein [Colwellia demingiae]TWX67151.1 hypothetical protein ESZ36_12600 [Colwellia demingiae]
MSSVDKDINTEKWRVWVDSMTDQKYVDIISRSGQLNRRLIAKGCGFSKTTLRDNPDICPELKQLEDDLRDRNVLPQLTEKGEKELLKPKDIQKESTKAAREQSRVPDLEQQIIELKAENAALRGKFGRFSELSDTFADLGEL